MSKAARDWCKAQQIADASMKSVLSQLAYLHKEGRELFPSQRTLAETCGMSVRSVHTALRLLQHFGVIDRRPRIVAGTGRTSDVFTIKMDHPIVVSRDMVRVARKAFRPKAPPGTRFIPPLNEVHTNRTLVEEPVQEGESLRVEVTTTRDGQAGSPRLRLIAGGKP